MWRGFLLTYLGGRVPYGRSTKPTPTPNREAMTNQANTLPRLIGVELEAINLTTGQAAQALIAAGIATRHEGHTHNGTALTANGPWKVVYDGSVSGGFEAVSPPTTNLDEVAAACRALRGAGARVNRSCGTHVHVDARDLTVDQVRRLCRLWLVSQVAIESVLAPSRRNRGWCKRNAIRHGFNRATTIRQLAAGFGVGRYHALNLQAYSAHGTIEFRGHQGTLDGVKIANWATLLVRLVEWARTATDADVPTRTLNLDEVLALVLGAAPAATTPARSRRSAPQRRPRAGTNAAAMWDIFEGFDTRCRTNRVWRSACYDACERAGHARHVARRTFTDWLRFTSPAPVAQDAHPRAAELVAFFRARAVALAAPTPSYARFDR